MTNGLAERGLWSSVDVEELFAFPWPPVTLETLNIMENKETFVKKFVVRNVTKIQSVTRVRAAILILS